MKKSYGATFGRNYFNRSSAPETEYDNMEDELEEFFADKLSLKKLVVDYLYPEISVKKIDGAAFGRYYSNRSS